jgi:hypothetical protein
MLKKIFISIILTGLVCNVSFSADEFTLLREERIGTLRIELTEREVKKAIPCRLKREPDISRSRC